MPLLLLGCSSSPTVFWASPDFTPEETAEIRRAVTFWATATDAAVEFSDQREGAVAVLRLDAAGVARWRLDDGQVAKTHVPDIDVSGGTAILVAIDRVRAYSRPQLAEVVAHEMGHVLDLQHVGDYQTALMTGRCDSEGYAFDFVGRGCLSSLDTEEFCRAQGCTATSVRQCR
jgi:hypothetical protein